MKLRCFEGIEYPTRPLIVVEGIVGVGKTTQAKLLNEFLSKNYSSHGVHFYHEPGSDEVADEMRYAVQVKKYSIEMHPMAETYMYAASRAQVLPTQVRPALESGKVALGDRSVITSCSYQGYGRELGLETVVDVNRQAVGDLWPSLALVVDVPIQKSLERAHDKLGDKFDSFGPEFFERAVFGYHELAIRNPQVVKIIDGDGSIEEVAEGMRLLVCRFLSEEFGW